MLIINRVNGLISEYDSGFSVTASTLLMNDQDWHFAGLTLDSTGKRFFLDSAFESKSSTPSGKTMTIREIGRNNISSRAFIGNIALLYVWERNFNDFEIMDIQQDPYQFLMPGMNAYIPDVVAGGFQAAWAMQRSGIIGGR